MKYLLIGDPHVKKSDRAEFARIILWTKNLCTEHNALPIFLGDQYNDFGIAKVEVMSFWDASFRMYNFKPFALVGNHDMNGDASNWGMVVHRDVVNVIDKSGAFINEAQGIYGIGFTRDNRAFIEKVQSVAGRVRTVICHAEFESSQYDNGFYAPNGIPLKDLPTGIQYISGHIHKQQEFGSIWYPGTSRHLTRSDIGEVKGVWLWDGKTNQRQFFATPPEVAEPYRQIDVVEGQPIPEITDSERNYVDIKGSEDFIQKVCKKLPESVKVRTFPDQKNSMIDIKESEGIPTAFRKYARHYVTEKVLTVDMTQKVLNEIFSKCPSLKVGVASGS